MAMNVFYAEQPLRKSIFLLGPTPRSAAVPSWRPQALAILEALAFDGDVFAPERDDWASMTSYDAQVNWEWEGINQCTQAVFWIDRDLDTMPGFTSNVEFGLCAASSKAILGRPDHAPKMRYLDKTARRYGIPIVLTLREALELAVARCAMPFASWEPGCGLPR